MQGRFDDLSNRLQPTHIPLIVYDMQQEANHVLVRRNMRVRELRELLIARFVEGATSASEYAVYYEGRSLGLNETLASLPANAQLRLGRTQRQQETKDTLVLVFDRSIQFVVDRLPLVIGRHKQGQAVDINLGDLPDGATVSRRHALLLQQGSSYYVQNIAENSDRPLYVNDQPVNTGMMKELSEGALLRLGKITLTVRIQSKHERG
jgi:hypothetical protein